MHEIVAVSTTSVETRRTGSLEDMITDFIDAQDVCAGSKATYTRQMRLFVLWLEETDRRANLGNLRKRDILEYKKWLTKESKKTILSANGYLTVVRKFFAYLGSERIYANVAADIKGYRKPSNYNKDCLSKSQIKDVLEDLKRNSLEGLRDYALINLMARTGLRDCEVSRAKVTDIRQESGESVLWIQGKGRDSSDDFVLLTGATEKPIRQWLQARDEQAPDSPLFCSLSDRNKGHALSTRSISRICKQAFQRVGLDSSRLTAHSLRHTAITLALVGGATLQQTQSMARHSDPKTTMLYARNLNRVQSGAEKFIDFD